MSNANVGYWTNCVADMFGTITSGRSWFTRQPANTNNWILWQATRQKCDVDVVGTAYGGTLDGHFYQTKIEDIHYPGTDWNPSSGHVPYHDAYRIQGSPVYVREDQRALIYHLNYVFGDPGGLTSVDGGIWLGVHQNTSGYLIGAFFSALIQTNGTFTSSLISTNWMFNVDGIPVPDDFGSYPAADAYSSNSVTMTWTHRTIGTFDVRYYDENPRPFWLYNYPGTNAITNLTLDVSGVAFVDFSDETLGQQAGRSVSESRILSATNTPATYRWAYVTNATITGTAPIGSTITLLWTNQHSFGDLPYRLEAKDIDERVAYLRQLVWTTDPYWSWGGHTGTVYAGASPGLTTNESYLGQVDWSTYSWIGGWTHDVAGWLAAQPPIWGAGDWLDWHDITVPLAWYTMYPSFDTPTSYRYIVVTDAGGANPTAFGVYQYEMGIGNTNVGGWFCFGGSGIFSPPDGDWSYLGYSIPGVWTGAGGDATGKVQVDYWLPSLGTIASQAPSLVFNWLTDMNRHESAIFRTPDFFINPYTVNPTNDSNYPPGYLHYPDWHFEYDLVDSVTSGYRPEQDIVKTQTWSGVQIEAGQLAQTIDIRHYCDVDYYGTYETILSKFDSSALVSSVSDLSALVDPLDSLPAPEHTPADEEA